MSHETGIKARQIKAARALLDWSQDDLAVASGLSVATVRKLESGSISPRGKTNEVIRNAFEDSEVEFTDFDGVRSRPDHITTHSGREGLIDFYDDVYLTSKKHGGEILIVCESPNFFYADPKGFYADLLQAYREDHVQRMEKLKDRISIKCIFTGDVDHISTSSYAQYRKLSKHYVNSVPFYIYNDKYAVCIPNNVSSLKIVVLQSHSVSKAFREQFYSMWDKATSLAGK